MTTASLIRHSYDVLSAQHLFLGLGIAVLLVILQVLINYICDPFDLRKYPSPSIAAFTNAWSAFHSRKLRRSRAIYDAHQNLGPIIRIQPRHISFAVPEAIQDIYGHKSPIVKDTFYDTIAGADHKNIVSTRDREEHAQKRRYISHAFSQRNIMTMEPLVVEKVGLLVKRLDRAAEAEEVIDLREWINFFTFDVICSMAFSEDPGFLRSGVATTEAESMDGRKSYKVNPIEAFQESTIHVASVGHWARLLAFTKPFAHWLPYGKRGDEFFDMCVHQIRKRLERAKLDPESDALNRDFFHHLTTDSKGEPRNLAFGELVEEASVFLSAGSDTTASAMTNTLYLLLKNPDTLDKLRQEIRESCGDLKHLESQNDGVLPYSTVNQLSYLRACLDEGLRHLPPTSIGLLRQTPPEGARIAGQWIQGGVTVSAPTYTIQHDPKLFKDPWTFQPQRWIRGDGENHDEIELENLKTYVFPFTTGRHACIGRNIAFLEQYVVISTLANKYDISFAEKDFELAVLERINANPGPMPVRVKRRY